MTPADRLFAAPHEDRCAEAVLWTDVRCVRARGHAGGHVGCKSANHTTITIIRPQETS